MALVINCECGVAVRGATDDELVQNAQDHAQTAHRMTITREQALALAETV
jgi:predicted small metal-binding protein